MKEKEESHDENTEGNAEKGKKRGVKNPFNALKKQQKSFASYKPI